MLPAALWLPQLGQNMLAGGAGTWDAWGAPQEGQNLLPSATALPQYGQLTDPGSTISVCISMDLLLFKTGDRNAGIKNLPARPFISGPAA